jgi:hypothetical protein
MASFPAVFPMPNAANAAGEAAGAASSVYNSLQNRIAAAADQQAKQQRQQQLDQQSADQRGLENMLQLEARGAVPAEIIGQGPNGMKTRTPNPAAQGEGQTVQEPQSGKRFYVPTQSERDRKQGKTFRPTGQLADALKTAGWDGETDITPEQSHGIMQSLNEAQPKDEPYEYDASGKYIDVRTGLPVPGFIGKKTKKFYQIDMSGSGGQQQQASTPGAAPGGPFDGSGAGMRTDGGAQPPASRGSVEARGNAYDFAPKEKEPKAPKSLHFETHTNDRGDVTTFGYDPETMELKSTHVAKGVGPQRKDPADPNAPPKPKPMTPANARIIVQNKAKALGDAQKAYTKAASMALNDDDKNAALDDLRNAQKQAQLNYEQELSAATGNEIPHNNWADVIPTPAKKARASATGAKGKANDPLGIR